MAGAVYAAGLKELRAELAKLSDDGTWLKELSKTHKEIGERAADWARFAAAGAGTRQQQTSIATIKGRGFPNKATLGVYATGLHSYALGAFYGAKGRFGWYADAVKYGKSRARQFEPWVGNSWDVAVAGTGPYHINDALAEHLSDIVDFYGKAVDALVARAFPN